jgi:phosphomannomutase
MSEPIISVSGLRGVIGESLDPQIAGMYALAFSASTPPGPFVITRDSRPSGIVLADGIHAVLNSTGRSTIDAAVAATPTTGVLIRQLHAAGGIQISASHNPIEYNGMKLFSADGRVVPKQQGQQVLERYREGKVVWVRHDKQGTRTVCKNTTSEHQSSVVRTVDSDAIRHRKFKVLLDSNHGAEAGFLKAQARPPL